MTTPAARAHAPRSSPAARYLHAAFLAAALLLIPLSMVDGKDHVVIQPLVDSLCDAVYGFDSERALDRIYGEARRRLEACGAQCDAYLQSRVEYLMGISEINHARWQSAGRYLRSALARIERMLDEGVSSAALSMKADILGQLFRVHLALHDPLFVAIHASSAVEATRTALKLDPENGRAHMLLGLGNVYASALYGGDIHEGIRLLKKALRKPGLGRDDRFNTYLGMGTAFYRLGKFRQARICYELALGLYPANHLGQELRNKALVAERR
jgi:tetratricopeptide (TPR) repeat protein